MQRAVLYVKQHGKSHPDSVSSFVEEAVIRRELSDNFCYYNENYDSVTGATDWAQKTLNDHRKDKRDYVYSRDQLEQGRTHDDLERLAAPVGQRGKNARLPEDVLGQEGPR